MTLAQSGQSHRLSTVSSGWGWAFDATDDAQMLEMTNLSTFVTNSLRRVTVSKDEAEASLDLSHRLKNVPDVVAYLPKHREEAEKQKARYRRMLPSVLGLTGFCCLGGGVWDVVGDSGG